MPTKWRATKRRIQRRHDGIPRHPFGKDFLCFRKFPETWLLWFVLCPDMTPMVFLLFSYGLPPCHTKAFAMFSSGFLAFPIFPMVF